MDGAPYSQIDQLPIDLTCIEKEHVLTNTQRATYDRYV